MYRRSQNVNSSFSRRGVKAHTGTLRPEMSQAVVRRLRTTACQLSRANSTLCAFAPPRVRKNGRTSNINLAHYRRSNVLWAIFFFLASPGLHMNYDQNTTLSEAFVCVLFWISFLKMKLFYVFSVHFIKANVLPTAGHLIDFTDPKNKTSHMSRDVLTSKFCFKPFLIMSQ